MTLKQSLVTLLAVLASERGGVSVEPEPDLPLGDDVELVDDVLAPDPPSGEGHSAPAPSGAPAPAAQPPAQTPAAGVDRGDGRDAQGKFAKPGDAPAAAPQAPAAPQGAPATPAAPGASAAAPAAPAQPALRREEYAAFSYRGGNEDAELPHSFVGSNGVFIANEGVPALRQLLAEAHGYGRAGRRREAELVRQVTELQNSPDLLRAKSYSDQIQALFKGGPDAVVRFFDDFDKNRDKFLAQAEQDVLRKQNEDLQARLEAHDDEAEGKQIGPVIGAHIDRTLQSLAASYPGVDAASLKARLVKTFWDQIVYEVDPKVRRPGYGEQVIGQSRKGTQYVLNVGAIEQEMAYASAVAQRRAAPVAAAAATNAAAIAAAQGGPVPPAPPAGAPPVPATDSDELPEIKDRAGLDAYWDNYLKTIPKTK